MASGVTEAQEGENFTAKFENLVRKCYQELPAKNRELEAVTATLSYERKRLILIRSKAQDLENAMYRLDTQLKSWSSQAKTATEAVAQLIDRK